MRTNNPPQPAKVESRISFGIAYFTSEGDAERYAEYVQSQGYTYNGGYFHGMPCGRDTTWDHEMDGIKYYAVTE